MFIDHNAHRVLAAVRRACDGGIRRLPYGEIEYRTMLYESSFLLVPTVQDIEDHGLKLFVPPGRRYNVALPDAEGGIVGMLDVHAVKPTVFILSLAMLDAKGEWVLLPSAWTQRPSAGLEVIETTPMSDLDLEVTTLAYAHAYRAAVASCWIIAKIELGLPEAA
jgi:hypothetical protein